MLCNYQPQVETCQICNFRMGYPGRHLLKNHPEVSQKEYYLKYINKDAGKCKICNKETSFKRITEGFKIYCSDICSMKDPVLNEKRKEKRKENLQKKYGFDVTNVMHISEIRNKVKENVKKSFLEKYGVSSAFKLPSAKQKGIDTRKNKTFEEKTLIYEKRKGSLQKKWGSEVTCGALVPTARRQKDTQRFNELITFIQNQGKYILNLSLEEFLSIRERERVENAKFSLDSLKKIYPLTCLKHNLELMISSGQLYNFKNTGTNHLCPKCQNGNISNAEKEVLEFVKNIYPDEVISNSKKIIPPLELDIFIPEFNLGIEYHGLYWHSFADKNYHLSKYILSKEKGIKLIQIFEDEWKQNPEIIKSIIKNKMNLIKTKIYARNLNIIENIDKQTVKDFLNKNHISGHTNFIKVFGLEDEHKNLISVLTLRKPFTKSKKGIIEIARFCSGLNLVVVGGFSKLLKKVIEWSKVNSFTNILTYSDLRFGEGNTYLNCGFTLINRISPNYFYTSGEMREGRFKYRAQNHISEDSLTESLGLRRIYDCGSNKYFLTL